MPANDLGIIGHVRFRVGFAAVLLLVGVGLCMLFKWFPATDVFLNFLVTVVAGFAVVYGAYYANLTLTSSVRRDSVRHALQVTNVLNSRELNAIRTNLLREIDHKILSPKQIHDKVFGNPELHSQVGTLLGYFEDVAIAIEMDSVDELTLNKSLGYLIESNWQQFAEYVRQLRELRNRDDLYSELEKLRNAWATDHSLLTGKPLDD